MEGTGSYGGRVRGDRACFFRGYEGGWMGHKLLELCSSGRVMLEGNGRRVLVELRVVTS